MHHRCGLVRAAAAATLVAAFLCLALPVAVARWGPPPLPPGIRPYESTKSQLARGTVVSIDLPFEEPVVPDGPNRDEFVALCRLCHSTRLSLNQPRFPEKKWAEIVHKMVTVYGAPIPPDQEAPIVAYLVAVRGPKSK
jgi:hypothetical protein